MTLCLLVRHAAHDLLGRVLVGRQDGVALNATGHCQARRLAAKLGALRITHVQSSPRDRALQTARPIAAAAGLGVETCAALDEVDFGSWTGRRFDDLSCDSHWRRWNEERGHACAPGGERMAHAQARIIAHLHDMRARHPRGRIVMVSHAEPIRAAVLHFMALPLDAWPSVEVPPASITKVQILSPGRALINLEEPAAA